MVISALIYVSNDLRTDEKADLASCNEALVRRNRILYHIHRKPNTLENSAHNSSVEFKGRSATGFVV